MIGLGAGLTSDSGSFEDTPFTTLVLTGVPALSATNDETIIFFIDAEEATKRGLSYDGFF